MSARPHLDLLRVSHSAFKRANRSERARITEAQRGLATAMLEESPLRAGALAVQRALPREFSGLFMWGERGPGRCGHSRGRGEGWADIARSDLIGPLAQYDPVSRGPWSNRLDDSRRWPHTAAIISRTREEFWSPNDWCAQLRFAFYDGPRFLGVLAILAERGRGFDDSDARVAEGVAASCAELLWADRITGGGTAAATLLGAALDALDEPVLLVSGTGTVIHASTAGREWAEALRPALAMRPGTARGRGALRAIARVAPIEVEGRTAFLVRPRAALMTPPRPRVELAPALARIAELVVMGLSDKEIAEKTGLSLATVRTYVQRTYARLGVRSRASLGRLWHRGV